MGCGLQSNGSKGIDNRKHVDNQDEVNIKEHVKDLQNSPDLESPETAGPVSYLSGWSNKLTPLEMTLHMHGRKWEQPGQL